MDGMTWGIVAAGVVAAAGWFMMRRTVDVACTIDLESTHDHFHAHVDLDGVEVDPGDAVLVHNTPTRIPFGTQRTYTSRATVQRASWLRRQFVKLTGGTELYELYDVGFEG
ncbi:MAG: hypothetical protein P3C09_02335 [Gemmatimonadota bacterium]|jgi:hypothetical protein|nr:hypothetical protein [Gemmatimonadota bacterium]MDQ8166580.1 hypothetical protein [Gemmatimonadota bacterium]